MTRMYRAGSASASACSSSSDACLKRSSASSKRTCASAYRPDKNVDHAESVKNSHVRTIPDLQAHASFFANFQLPEQRKFREKSTAGAATYPGRITQSLSNIA